MDRNQQDELELEELEFRDELDGQVLPAPCQEAFCAFNMAGRAGLFPVCR